MGGVFSLEKRNVVEIFGFWFGSRRELGFGDFGWLARAMGGRKERKPDTRFIYSFFSKCFDPSLV